MSSKKRYIPIIALGALLLSLLAILPVAAAGEVTFIDPGDVNDDNSGTLKDSTPDDQTSARQGGQVGVLYEDDDLSRPIRRVLVLAWDADEAGSGEARPDVVAHSNVLKNMSLGDLTGTTDSGILEPGDYVYVGGQPDLTDTTYLPTVRKVDSVVRTADTIDEDALAAQRYDVTIEDAFQTDRTGVQVWRIKNAVTSMDAFEENYKDISAAPIFTATLNQARIEVGTPIVASSVGADGSTAAAASRLKGTLDTRLNSDDVLIAQRGGGSVVIAPAEIDEVRDTGRINLSDSTPADAANFTTNLTANPFMLVYWAATRNETGSDLTIQTQTVQPQPFTLRESTDGSGNFAAVVDLVPSTVTVPWSALGSVTAADPNADPPTAQMPAEGESVTLSGTHAGKEDLMVKFPRGWESGVTGTVLVETVPDFTQGRTGEDDQYVPRLPVNERDTVTVNHPDGSQSLSVESTNPVFSNFSPAHNSTGDDSRPTVTVQVTDGDSGLKESNVGVVFAIRPAGSSITRVVEKIGQNADSEAVSGGFEVSARLSSTEELNGDGEILWWAYAKDNAGNVGYSDRLATKSNGDEDPCTATSKDELETDARTDSPACDPHVIKVDGTDPKIHHAETGRWWDTSLSTGDSDDKTEYRTSKANRSTVLLIFNEGLDPATVQASDFEVNDSPPSSADVYNVKVRDDNVIEDDEDTGIDESSGDGNADYYDADAIPQFVGQDKGYVFLTLGNELTPNARPKVEMVGEVSDLAGNRQTAQQRDPDATDRIGPKLSVTIAEGDRPVTSKDVTITVTADENIGTPAVSFYKVNSTSVEDGDPVQLIGSENTASATFVSAREYTAKLTAPTDGLYTVYVSASDSSGNNEGVIGDKTRPVDVDGETTAILFERDKKISAPDFDPSKDGVNNSFETDDANGFIRIDYSAEANEYYQPPSGARVCSEQYVNGNCTDADLGMDDIQEPNTATVTGDDLDTHGRLTVVSATLDGTDISGDLNPNTDSNVFQYHLNNMAVGEYDLEMVVRDEAGNQNAAAHKGTIKIIERKPYKLTLNPGWNLVSLPGQPADTDINAVIPANHPIDAVRGYDPMVPGAWLIAEEGGDGAFSGTLETIEAGIAYWIKTTSFESLEVDIPKPTPGSLTLLPTIQISQGWNLVPVLDVDGDFELDAQSATDNYFSGLTTGSVAAIYTYNTITNSWMSVAETGVSLGKGYWVYATKPGVIVP